MRKEVSATAGPCNDGLSRSLQMVFLAAILALSLGLNLYGNDFPLGYHVDEIKKVRFIRDNTQDFNHPILMLQVVRTANAFTRFSDEQDIVELGRTINAFFGMLIVACAYLLCRKTSSDRYLPLLAAFAVATSPIMVVHAHYLKEDIILTFFLMVSLLILLEYVHRPGWTSAAALGVAMGLACASHYKGSLLVILCALVSVLLPGNRRSCLRMLPVVVLSVAAVFLAVNYPLIFDYFTFKRGFIFEYRHALGGHYGIKISAIQQYGGFHLINSLVPGVTAGMAIIGAVAIAWSAVLWRKAHVSIRILLLYIALFYMLPELSPLKPFPDFMRYVIPIVPPLILFALMAVKTLWSSVPNPGLKMAVPLVMIAIIIYPLYCTIRLVHEINDDTRARAEAWLQHSSQKAKYELYTSAKRYDVKSVTRLNVEQERKKGVAFFVSSSFMYERFEFGSTLPDQHPFVYKTQEKYKRLFALPFVEFKPEFRSFGFSNPTIRVIDIR